MHGCEEAYVKEYHALKCAVKKILKLKIFYLIFVENLFRDEQRFELMKNDQALHRRDPCGSFVHFFGRFELESYQIESFNQKSKKFLLTISSSGINIKLISNHSGTVKNF